MDDLARSVLRRMEYEAFKRGRADADDEIEKLRARIAALEAENTELRKLVIEHHNVVAMEGLEWGQECPVCVPLKKDHLSCNVKQENQ